VVKRKEERATKMPGRLEEGSGLALAGKGGSRWHIIEAIGLTAKCGFKSGNF
jgi:hypothetical protein